MAGGYQANGENVTGLNYCIQKHENFTRIYDLEAKVRLATDGLLESPGHFVNIIAPHYTKVNLGVAWDSHIVWLVQHFEADYMRFSEVPTLRGTQLQFAGQVANGASLDADQNGLKVDVYRHPLSPVTRGQLASAFCLDLGELLATFIPPPPPGSSYGNLTFPPTIYQRCHSPYDAAPLPGPASYYEAKAAYAAAVRRPLALAAETVQFVVADEWQVGNGMFRMSADIKDVLDAGGDGAYQLMFWGKVKGQTHVIADYWLFHGVEPPAGYGNQ